MKPPVREGDTARSFWDRHYAAMTAPTSGRPSALLERFVADRPAGRALELGCGRGDDAMWLAGIGWDVTAVDVSGAALDYVRSSSEAAGVAGRVHCERHDLSHSLPSGSFDLVLSVFMHSPVAFDRTDVLRRAVLRVGPGGLLLIAAHGSLPPWTWADPDTRCPTAEETFAQLRVPTWTRILVEDLPREAHGSNGMVATVLDSVIVLERPLA